MADKKAPKTPATRRRSAAVGIHPKKTPQKSFGKTRQRAKKPDQLPSSHQTGCPVVGIGASAGGLGALEQFFQHLPADTGLAFVVITHQSSDQTTILPELLSKQTAMAVHQVDTDVQIAPNHVYLPKPGSVLNIQRTQLRVIAPADAETRPSSPQFPIDTFFRSLAEDRQETAMCVILSGTGTDGTLGLEAVKGVGGMTMAQEEVTAQFAGMPHSAIASGMVDYVVSASDMPHVLLNFARQRPETAHADVLPEQFIQDIQNLLLQRTKHDFSMYKPNTLRRRVERRINVHQLSTPDAYLAFLQEHPYELDLLFQELLIGVTTFFRDPEAYDFLSTTALPQLLTERPEQQPIRLWVPGCSTGEEAYSLAIIVQEVLEREGHYHPVQVFATDLNTQAIETARAGLYPFGIAVAVSPARLTQYFIKEDKGYRIHKEIRDMIVFAPQNLLGDPPFTKLDLVSCRNLLIYLNGDAQRRLMLLFHYILHPGGLLFLGSSETIGSFSDLFAPLDLKQKIFRRKESAATAHPLIEFALETGRPPTGPLLTRLPNGLPRPATSFATQVLQTLVAYYAPPSVIISENGEIVFIHGQTGRFLQLAPGLPSYNIFSMAGEGLQMDLSVAIRQAATHQQAVVQKNVTVKTDGTSVQIDLIAQRLDAPEALQGLFLIGFSQAHDLPSDTGKQRQPTKRGQSRIAELEREIRSLRETLQSTIEEANTANEELRSTNEEFQSTNEELQSSNEELETAKEEMQSLNEELQTVNTELQKKVESLSQANDDMQNLLNSTDIATLFLDNQLHIKRFTPQAKRVIKLIDSDVGRPIGDLVSNLQYENLEADAREVLQTRMAKEREVVAENGEWYFARILPYWTSENVIDGLVLTFVETTKQKQAEQDSHEAHVYMDRIGSTLREPILALDEHAQVVSANPALYRMFQLSEETVLGKHLCEVGAGTWDVPALRQLLAQIQGEEETLENIRLEHMFPGLGHKVLLFNARKIKRTSKLPELTLLAIEDITRPQTPGSSRGSSSKNRRVKDSAQD